MLWWTQKGHSEHKTEPPAFLHTGTQFVAVRGGKEAEAGAQSDLNEHIRALIPFGAHMAHPCRGRSKAQAGGTNDQLPSHVVFRVSRRDGMMPRGIPDLSGRRDLLLFLSKY